MPENVTLELQQKNMTLTPIVHVEAEQIIREISTQGSAPLLVFANDGNAYFCKSTIAQLPAVELINEVIVGYIARCWGIPIPNSAIVSIPQTVVDTFKEEGNALSGRYSQTKFDSSLFFGSQRENAVELEGYISKLSNKNEFKIFQNPIDLIKIGLLDLWVGNRDRSPENPNVILTSNSENKIKIQPIDHTAAFAYSANYQKVTDVFLFLDEKSRILRSPLIKSIATFAARENIGKIEEEVLSGMDIVLQNLDFIFAQVPPEWGFSKKAKKHLKSFFSDTKKNKQIAKSHISYLK